MDGEETRESEDNPYGSFVHFGENNTFWGSFGDIAGRDINKTLVINYYPPGTLSKKERVELELEYLLRVIDELQGWSTRFVDLDLRVNNLTKPTVWFSGLEPYIGEEFELLVEQEEEGDLSKQPTVKKSLFELFTHKHFWLLRGEPGTGKTTLLRKAIFEQAVFSRKLKSQDSKTSYHYPFAGIGGKIPLFLSLYLYDGVVPILDLIKNSWLGSPLGLDVETYLRLGEVLLLVDDIDFVPPAIQPSVLYRIRDLIETSPGNQCVVTTRKYSLSNEFDFPTCTVEPMNETQIQTMLAKYAGDLGGQLYDYLTRNRQELLWLAKKPYTLLMLAEIYIKTGGSIPENLAALFDGFTNALITRELRRKQSKLELTKVREELALLAFELTQETSGKNLTWDSKTASQTAEGPKKKVRHDALGTGRGAGILLVGEENATVGFVHKQLQAYFAALAIKTGQAIEEHMFIRGLKLASHEPLPFSRAKPFQRMVEGEVPWDSPMPILTRGGWYHVVDMLLAMRKDPGTLLNDLTLTNPILVADLLDSSDNVPRKPWIDNVQINLLNLSTGHEKDKRVRLTAGYWLGILGDGRATQKDEIHISGKKGFVVGRDLDAHSVDIKAFWVDRYLVTNAQFQEFIDDDGYRRQSLWTQEGWLWIERMKRKRPTFWEVEKLNFPNLPVVGVTWYEATAFAKWRNARLLNEAEWEYLATYNPETEQKQIYPWGDSFSEDAANIMVGDYMFRPTPIGMYPKGVNYWGVHDLVGNVWEWLSSLYLPYPIDFSLTERKTEKGVRCLRGGSWGFDSKPGAMGHVRHYGNPTIYEYTNVGFRCARNSE